MGGIGDNGRSWVVVGDGGKILAGRGWWHQNYGWSWVGVVDCGWSHNLVMPNSNYSE